MNDIAPLNYERWAVIVSPLLVPDAPEGGYAVPLRHPEGLVQVGASLGRLDSRKKESLIEQTFQPVGVRRKVPERKPAPPPATSHPPEWVLRQPLPMGTLASARNDSVVDIRKAIEAYAPRQPTPDPSVRVSG